jgi:hypothetical protein
MKGDLLLKYNSRAIGKPHKRFFFMHLFREPVIFWSDSDTVSTSLAGTGGGGGFTFFKTDDFKQAVIQDVVVGPSDEVLKTHQLTDEIKALSFSLITSDRRMDLIAPTQEIFILWTAGLGKVLDDYQKGFIGLGMGSRLRVELVLQKSLGGTFDVEEQRKKFEAEQRKKEEDTKRALNEMKYAIKKTKAGTASAAGYTDVGSTGGGDDGVSGKSRQTVKVDEKTAQALKASTANSTTDANQ